MSALYLAVKERKSKVVELLLKSEKIVPNIINILDIFFLKQDFNIKLFNEIQSEIIYIIFYNIKFNDIKSKIIQLYYNLYNLQYFTSEIQWNFNSKYLMELKI